MKNVKSNVGRLRNMNETEEKKIREILAEEGLFVIGFSKFDDTYMVGAKIANYEEVTARIRKRIKDEVGVDTIINL